MKILITGSTGMVGRNIVENNADNHILLTPSRNEVDLLDYNKIYNYIKENQPDLIIHVAGVVGGIQANISNPVKFLVENTEIGKNVISAAQKNKVKRLLNVASSCMYPRNAPNPLKEEMILTGELEPTNEGYALAKIFAQRLCTYISREDSFFEYKTVIPCNLYGRWDKFDEKRSHMVPAAIRKIHEAKVKNKNEVVIWGTGTARREFMYAGDFADFIWFAVKNFDIVPETMNVGLGYDFTINQYYETIAKVIGYKGKFIHDFSKPEGMKRKLVDITKLEKLGWKPKHTLEEGVKKTYEFFLEHYINR